MKRLTLPIVLFLFVSSFSYGQSSFIPDSTVNAVMVLRNKNSAEKFSQTKLESFVVNEFDTCLFEEEQPFVLFINDNKTEYLMAIIHEGTSSFLFSEFKIGYLCFDSLIKFNIQYIQTPYLSFFTESGLKLGITSMDVVDQKGTPTLWNSNQIVYCLDLNGFGFDENNVCDYYLQCTIHDDKVTKIEYGYSLR